MLFFDWFARSIIKTDLSRFEAPMVRATRRDSLPGYDEPYSVIGYRRGGGGASLTRPSPERLQLQSSMSIEKKRKTVRMSDSYEYYSDYNNDRDDW